MHGMSHTPTLIIVPGWRDSGPEHWQSLWANTVVGAVRVKQDNWISPIRSAWVQRIAETIKAQNGPVILAAHSLGCIASTSLPTEVAARIHGALLVAPADPERRAALRDFSPVPHQELPYPSIVVAGTNDPYCSPRTAGAYARAWKSTFVRLPNAGHINVDSGFGDWPFGWTLLQSLVRPPFTPFRLHNHSSTVE